MRQPMATLLGEELESSQLIAVSSLQKLLPELKALELNAKQVHWNVTGQGFLPLHELTDQISQDTDEWADRVAERCLALGFPVDGRPQTVAAAGGRVRAGRIADYEAAIALVGLVDGVAATAWAAVDVLERNDPVGHDLVLEVLHGLERYRWMLRAQVAGRTNFPLETPAWSPASAGGWTATDAGGSVVDERTSAVGG